MGNVSLKVLEKSLNFLFKKRVRTLKQVLGQYLSILTSRLVNSACFFVKCGLRVNDLEQVVKIKF